jgi:hypothetical protein
MKRLHVKLKAFHLGAAGGFALGVALVLLVKAWIGPEFYSPRYNVEVVSRGEDVSRHAGRTVQVASEQGLVAEQICSDACDDFEFQASSTDNVYTVRVLDAAGRCLACDPGMYVTSGYVAPITRWTVAGAEALRVNISLITREPDGSFVERPLAVRREGTADPQRPGTVSPD